MLSVCEEMDVCIEGGSKLKLKMFLLWRCRAFKCVWVLNTYDLRLVWRSCFLSYFSDF